MTATTPAERNEQLCRRLGFEPGRGPIVQRRDGRAVQCRTLEEAEAVLTREEKAELLAAIEREGLERIERRLDWKENNMPAGRKG